MKVNELIDKLKKCNPNAIVYIWDCEYSTNDDIDGIFLQGNDVVIGGYEGEIV